MKNIAVAFALVFALAAGYLISTKYDFRIDKKTEAPLKVSITQEAAVPTAASPSAALDTDKFGCKTSEGLVWCESKKTCVKENVETCGDEDLIAQALATKHGWQVGDIVVTVTKFNGTYARGLVNDKGGGGGGIYWAVKKLGVWNIVQDGNGIPDCNVLKTDAFPKDFLNGACE